MSRFIAPKVMPQFLAKRPDIYNEVENAKPGPDLVGPTLQVVGDKVHVADGIPRWVKVTKTHADFQAAASTNSVELLLLPAGAVVEAMLIRHSTAFAGPSISAYTLSGGVSGSVTKYCAARDVFAAVNAVPTAGNTLGVESTTGTISLRAYATSTGANLSVSTAGAVDFWIRYAIPAPTP